MNILFEIAAVFSPLFDFFSHAIGYIGAAVFMMILIEKCRAHFFSKQITVKGRRQYD